ncbi:hypothetical protein OPQ81_003114 [Rhizoctonia solani]|nr:hypothetical protein OPQ81_003114 [Rhizoctonia solani]
MAQHYHATSPHPSFNTPALVTPPPPQDPFGQLGRSSHDGYFPLMPSSSKNRDSTSKPRKKVSKSKSQSSRVKIEHPQPIPLSPPSNSSRTPISRPPESGTSESTPQPLSRIGHEAVGKPSSLIPVAVSPSASTPTQLKSRSRRSTPPHLKTLPPTPQAPQVVQTSPPKSSSPPSQPSIDAFRDCFGVLTTRVENVFPTRTRYRTSRSNSGGSENFNVMGSGPSLSDFQRRWTKRWIRRTLRGVGSMGSGSTSSGSASAGTGAGASRLRGGSAAGSSSMANTMIYLGLGSGTEEAREIRGSAGSGSQDSLDRVRVSRSNAPSPSDSNSNLNSTSYDNATAETAAASNGVKVKDFEVCSLEHSFRTGVSFTYLSSVVLSFCTCISYCDIFSVVYPISTHPLCTV